MNEQIEKQLLQVVCICKGIRLRQILKGLEHASIVSDVNKATGAGSGGCQGQRCGPKIRILLDKKRKLELEKRREADVCPS